MNLSSSLSHVFPIRAGPQETLLHEAWRLEEKQHQYRIWHLQAPRKGCVTHTPCWSAGLPRWHGAAAVLTRTLCFFFFLQVSDSWVRWRSGPAASAVHPPEDWGKWELAWVLLCSRAFAHEFHCAPLYVPLAFPIPNLWAWNPSIDTKAWTLLGTGTIWPIIPTTWEDEAWVPG